MSAAAPTLATGGDARVMHGKRLLVLMVRVQGKDVPIAVYPAGTPNGLVADHLARARAQGLAFDRHRLVPLPVLLAGGTLYVPKGAPHPTTVRVHVVQKPVFLL